MGSPPSKPGSHRHVKVSFSGDLQLMSTGFPGGEIPGCTHSWTLAHDNIPAHNMLWNIYIYIPEKCTKTPATREMECSPCSRPADGSGALRLRPTDS